MALLRQPAGKADKGKKGRGITPRTARRDPMQKKMLLGVTLLGVRLASWITSRGIGLAEAAGQQQEQAAPQNQTRFPDPGSPPQGDSKTLPTIPQEYFPP